jgi:hypothetical protein
MKIFYRLSDCGNVRLRVIGTSKQKCLESFLKNFHLSRLDSMFILADSVTDETWENLQEWIKGYKIEVKRTQAGSEAGSFRLLLDEFKSSNLKSTDYVFFLEDDYIYLPNSREIIEEGLLFGDYATLRLHPDKFIPPSKGGNPLLDERGGEATRVYLGADRFWMLTNSTGMQFAANVTPMREDLDIWYKNVEGRASRDFDCWLELRDKGRTLVMPIPTGMSHDELFSASPLVGTGYCCWEKALHGTCHVEAN